jgi:hypothetical protein
LRKEHVSRIGALQRLLAAAAHHHVENELVTVFVGIHAERADLIGLLRLVRIIERKANERRLAVAAFDGGELGDFRLGIRRHPTRIADAREIGKRLLLIAVIKHLHIDQRVGGGEARSVWHHDLDFVLPAGLLVDRPTVRRGQHELIGRAKLLAARVKKFLHFRAGRGAAKHRRGAGCCDHNRGQDRDHARSPHLTLHNFTAPRGAAGR